MKVTNVKLHNFLSHEKSDLDFDPRINVIIGENGSGKSSILEAIYFALYGEPLRDSIASLIRRIGPRMATSMSVRLEFELGGRKYSVTREVGLERGSAKTRIAKLTDETVKRILAEGPRAIEGELVRLIGIDAKTFRYSVFVPQGEIGRILEERAGERRRLFMELIGISELDRLHDLLMDLEKDLRSRSREIGHYKGMLDKTKKNIAEKEKERIEKQERLEEVSKEHEALLEALGKLRPRLERAKTAKTRLEEKEARLAEISKNLEEKEARLEDLSAKLGALPRLEEEVRAAEGVEKKVELVREILELEERISSLRGDRRRSEELKEREEKLERWISEHAGVEQDLDSAKRELYDTRAMRKQKETKVAELESEISRIEAELRALPKGDLEQVSAELERLRAELDAAMEERGAKVGRRRMLEEELRLLGSASGVCPTCGRPLSEEKRRELMEAKTGELERIESELELLERRIGELQAKLRELEDLREGLKRRAELEDRLHELKYELKSQRAELEGLRISEDSLIKKIEELEREVRILRSRKEELNEIRGELKALERKMEGLDLGALEKRKDEIIAEYIKAFGEIPVISQENLEELEERARELSEKRQFLAELKALKGQHEELKATIAELRKEEKRLKREIEKLREETEGLEELETRVANMEGRERELNAEREALERELRRIESELEESREDLDLLGKRVEEMERLLRAADKIKDIRGALRTGIKQRYNEIVLAYLKGRMPSILSDLGLNFVEVDLDGDLNLTLVTPEAIRMSYRELSGGEKVLVSLAFRLALLNILGRPEAGLREPLPLVLDEPTTHLDDEHRRMVIQALRNYYYRVQESIPQLIIVSHYSEFRDVATKLFEVKKESGVSRVYESSAQQ